MPGLNLIPLQEQELRILQDWFQDAELQVRLGGMLPLGRWFEYVCSEPGYFVWTAREDDMPVGLVALETGPDQTGWVAHLVNPELRGQGCGKRLLRAMLARPEIACLKTIKAVVEPDNVAAVRCCRSVGFAAEGSEPDEEGLVTLVYRLTS